jgi:metal-responsive CopG/Arc/MetJ family transcriptional regulator
MRTLVDIPEGDLKALDEISERRRTSRAGVIRHAIRDYLVKNRRGSLEEAFGLWRDKNVDGVEYQRRLRSEW